MVVLHHHHGGGLVITPPVYLVDIQPWPQSQNNHHGQGTGTDTRTRHPQGSGTGHHTPGSVLPWTYSGHKLLVGSALAQVLEMLGLGSREL